MVKADDGTFYCSTAKPSEQRPNGWDTDGDGMPDEWEKANGFNPNDAADGNYINAEGYTALEKYLCSLMGEEIKGEFKTTDIQRREHAVKFNVSIIGKQINIEAQEGITSVHIFDIDGRCCLSTTVTGNSAMVNASQLGNGTYIIWVTNTKGYRNAKKISL